MLSVLGVPEGESARFYRDLAINLVFCAAAIVALAKFFFVRADTTFWICVSIAVVALVSVRDKRVPLATLALIIVTRLAFALLVAGLRSHA